MRERKRIIEVTAGRYRAGRKKEKGIILDEFTALTGYGRSYARLVLRNWGRVVKVRNGIGMRGGSVKKAKREGVRYYDEPVVKALTTDWRIMDYICGKRLGPVLGEMTELLACKGELKCTSERGNRDGQ